MKEIKKETHISYVTPEYIKTICETILHEEKEEKEEKEIPILDELSQDYIKQITNAINFDYS
jgi:hypothetical protein